MDKASRDGGGDLHLHILGYNVLGIGGDVQWY